MNRKMEGEIARLEGVLQNRQQRLDDADRDAARMKEKRAGAVEDIKARLTTLRARVKVQSEKKEAKKARKKKDATRSPSASTAKGR